MKYAILPFDDAPFIEIIKLDEHVTVDFLRRNGMTHVIVDEKFLPRRLTCGIYDHKIKDGKLVKLTDDEIAQYELQHSEQQIATDIANTDVNSIALIKRGFEFDDNVFSLSTSAQLNWNRILTMYSLGLLNSKIELSTKNNQLYVLSSERVKDFALAYHNAIEQVLTKGRAEKNEHTTIALVK